MTKKINRKGRIAIYAGSLIAIVLLVTGLTRDEKLFKIEKSLDIYYSLIRELNLFYVDEIDAEKLVKTSIDRMLETLDPYTTYIPESEQDDLRFMTTGEYGGIGALISKHDSVIVIAEPYEGFPAQKSGLKAGDIIIAVDGVSAKGKNTEAVSNMLKGPANKEVKVLIQRPGMKKQMTVSIMREKIAIDPVPYYGLLDDNKTGYIRLTNFTADCSKRVKSVFTELKEKGAEALVLDLRSNPGGLLNEAVEVANLFVSKGQEIVSNRGKLKQSDRVYYAARTPVDTVMPIAVLVNRSSASASEIVTGALQDLDRAVVVGGRTFGKGLVQMTRELSYKSSLKVTTSKYYLPSGRCIQALDYAHRNEDGSVGQIPDSLISEFLTRKGRKVYDGGGIVPDVVVDADRLSSLSFNLINEFYYFDFATLYANSHASIPAPEDFVITDEIFNEFKAFLKERKFTYQSRTEMLMESLIETAKEDKYYDVAKPEFDALKARVGHELDKDMDDFREEIGEILADEIAGRYYYQKGTIKAGLRADKALKKAREILTDPAQYAGIFTPGAVIAMTKSE
ncbi:MAG: S41 family peptidase [Bacteroidales bacterium]|jgi:carboxyl-terminal processing protease|nr:S41 family peptidase [Bacteroidales bacterium]